MTEYVLHDNLFVQPKHKDPPFIICYRGPARLLRLRFQCIVDQGKVIKGNRETHETETDSIDKGKYKIL
jgi:hypothetical protein